MKKVFLAFILMLLLSSCHTKSVFVWTVSDVAGLALLGIAVLVIIILFLRAAVLDFINNRKRKRNEFNKKTR